MTLNREEVESSQASDLFSFLLNLEQAYTRHDFLSVVTETFLRYLMERGKY